MADVQSPVSLVKSVHWDSVKSPVLAIRKNALVPVLTPTLTPITVVLVVPDALAARSVHQASVPVPLEPPTVVASVKTSRMTGQTVAHVVHNVSLVSFAPTANVRFHAQALNRRIVAVFAWIQTLIITTANSVVLPVWVANSVY